jgi:hypothetical protein
MPSKWTFLRHEVTWFEWNRKPYFEPPTFSWVNNIVMNYCQRICCKWLSIQQGFIYRLKYNTFPCLGSMITAKWVHSFLMGSVSNHLTISVLFATLASFRLALRLVAACIQNMWRLLLRCLLSVTNSWRPGIKVEEAFILSGATNSGCLVCKIMVCYRNEIPSVAQCSQFQIFEWKTHHLIWSNIF